MDILTRAALILMIGNVTGAAQAEPASRPAAFGICSACHVTTAGQAATVGPNLWNVAGRKAGTSAGFAYSDSMKKAGFAWTRANLTAFITSPASKVPGTKMTYAGQKDSAAVAQVVEYLLTLK